MEVKLNNSPQNSDGGVKLTASLPSSSNFDADFEFSTRYDNNEVEIRISKAGVSESFSVKKVDFLRALNCIFPNAIHAAVLRNAELNEQIKTGNPPPASPNSLGGLLGQLFGGAPGKGMDFKILGDFEFPPNFKPDEDDED